MTIGKDKIQHCVGSIAMTLVLGLLWFNPYVAGLISITIGILKEVIHDHLLKRGNCEWGDIYADALGTLIGVAVLLLI